MGERLGAPPNSRIFLQRDADALNMYAPAPGFRGSGRSLFFFSLFWNGFMALFTAAMFPVVQEIRHFPWQAFLFGIPFWAIGLWMLFFSLRQMFGKTMLRLERGRVFLKAELFGYGRLKAYELSPDSKATLAVAYVQNNKPVQCCAINTTRGQLKFGIEFSMEEKRWIISEINNFLGVKSSPEVESSENTEDTENDC